MAEQDNRELLDKIHQELYRLREHVSENSEIAVIHNAITDIKTDLAEIRHSIQTFNDPEKGVIVRVNTLKASLSKLEELVEELSDDVDDLKSETAVLTSFKTTTMTVLKLMGTALGGIVVKLIYDVIQNISLLS